MQSIRWADHSSHMMGLVADLYKNLEVMDCKLNTKGGFVLCHKILLAACSPYLKEKFKEHKGKIVIPLKEVLYSDMKLILDFIYFGEVDVQISQVASLMRTAEFLQISSLKCCSSDVPGMIPMQCWDEESGSKRDVNLDLCITDNSVFLNEGLHSSMEYRLGSVCENIDLRTFGETEPQITEVLQPESTGALHSDSTNSDGESLPTDQLPITFVAVKVEPVFDDHQGDMCCGESDLPDHHDEYPCNGEVTEAQEFLPSVEVKVENVEGTDADGGTVVTENTSCGLNIQHSSEDFMTSIVKEEEAYVELGSGTQSHESGDFDPVHKVKWEPFGFEPGFHVKEEKPFEPDLILRKIRINESSVKKESQDVEPNPNGKKNSARFSTKSRGRIRLSAKRKKPGPKKNSVRKPPKPPLIDLSVEDSCSNVTSKKFRRRLTLSRRRKKRRIPPGLVNWRIQQKMRKRAEELERAKQMEDPMAMEQTQELNT